jgi:rubredoxin
MTMPSQWFCPLCGDPLSYRRYHLYCERGATSISKAVEQAIAEAMLQPSTPPPTPPEKTDLDLTRHCPRCGDRLLKPSGGKYICPGCGLSLPAGMFYALQEYHDHRPK